MQNQFALCMRGIFDNILFVTDRAGGEGGGSLQRKYSCRVESFWFCLQYRFLKSLYAIRSDQLVRVSVLFFLLGLFLFNEQPVQVP